jgi:hypothetical protein
MSDDYDPGDHGYSLDDVCDRLDNIEAAVKANHWDLRWVGFVIFVWFALVGFADMWTSKLRYSMWYSVDYDQVTIQKKPTDCNFFTAPMGEKDCRYYRQVSTIQVKTENSNPARYPVNYVSFDEGKTWTVDDATPPTKPQVIVSWEKKDDD